MNKKNPILPKAGRVAGACLGLLLASPLWGASQVFDFKDPKGVNNAVFKLDAPLEAINGTASGISGKVTFDPDAPEHTQGKIVVETASMTVPNPMMKQHMLGGQWMDAEKHPEITFEALKVARVQRDGDHVTAQVTGRLAMRGVARELTVPVKFTHLKDKLGARTNGQMQGDLLVIRAEFKVKRADFGINPAAPTDKVAEEIAITLSVAGAAPRS